MMLFVLDYFNRLGKWIAFDLLKTLNWLNVRLACNHSITGNTLQLAVLTPPRV